MKKLLLLLFLLNANNLFAQGGSVTFDYPITMGETPIQVQGWIATLYVNGNPHVVNDVCTLTTTVTPNIITCSALLPNIITSLTPSGPQNFEVSLKGAILEGPKSSPPFVLTRPSATTGLRIQ